MFDSMAGDDGKAKEVTPLVQRLARLAIDLGETLSDGD